MKSVVVKKCKSHRTGIRWLFWGTFSLLCIAQAITKEWLLDILIMLPAALFLFPLYAYYEDWALTFTREEIIRHRWGRIRRYSWNDIREVCAARSTTDGEYVRIAFRDGREFCFRMVDENAKKAVKEIQSHRSIAWK